MANETTTTGGSDSLTKYQSNLVSALEQGLAAISQLKDQLVVQPTTNEEKKQNKAVQKQIKTESKKVSQLQGKVDKEVPRPPTSADNMDGKGRGEYKDFVQPDVSQRRFEENYGVTGFKDPEIQRLSQAADTQVEQTESDISAIRRLGQQLLTGNIPVDVSEAVSRAGASNALSRGIVSGSQLSRNLTVRDLGMTSLDLMSKGGEVLGTTAQLSQGLAAFQESRAQYRAQFQLASAELRDTIRKTDLTVSQLAEEKHQFKQKMTLALNQQITDLAMAREDIQFKYAASDKSPGGALSTFDNLAKQLRTSLSL
jgi:hypothetical protein